MLQNMRFRQVHLDFHTSPAIPSVGTKFSKEQFAEALRRGHVNSITIFSKCHHGYSFHPTTVNEMHPGLKFDLLGEELEVCRTMGINAPVYISAGLDEKEAVRHPEWLNIPAPGRTADYVNDAHYHLLCYNTPYLDLLLAQIEEVMQNYHPTGIFLDISDVRMCYCHRCVASMRKMGLNPHDPADVKQHGERIYAMYCQKVEAVVRKYDKNTTIFHNAGNIARGRRDLTFQNTHLELESLPTGGWGYDHFPMSAAYVRTLGMEYLGMTGKFHTTWGEFGGFKHPNALRYETALSIALGAKCSIGDQMHPSGEMNLSTYDLIGKAYEEVEKKEPWCYHAKNISDIAVLSAEAVNLYGTRDTKSDIGCCRMLLEGKYLFDLIDLETSFDPYKLLILPDKILVNERLAARLQAYLANGGKIIATGKSGLKPDAVSFAVDFGVTYEGPNMYRPSYMVPTEEVKMINGSTSYVMYTEAQNITLVDQETSIFAYLVEPYFNRGPEHFSSHQHTPDNPDSRRPAAVYHKNTAYIGWNIFEDYATKGSLCLKELFLHTVEKVLNGEQTISTTGLPDRGIVTLTKQDAENRMVCHLLFAHTSLRGNGIEVIEDIVPLYQIAVSVKVPKMPKTVQIVPENTSLPYTFQDGKVSFVVPKLEVHAMIEITF